MTAIGCFAIFYARVGKLCKKSIISATTALDSYNARGQAKQFRHGNENGDLNPGDAAVFLST